MSNYFKAIDRFAATLARRVIARRWLVLLLSLTLALGAGFGAGLSLLHADSATANESATLTVRY